MNELKEEQPREELKISAIRKPALQTGAEPAGRDPGAAAELPPDGHPERRGAHPSGFHGGHQEGRHGARRGEGHHPAAGGRVFKTVEGEKTAPAEQSAPESVLRVFFKGLWTNNPGLCQLLGLCPLLAVTTSAVNALGLALATILVMACSSLIISLLRKCLFREVRIPLYVVLIATLVTIVRFGAEAWFPDLHQRLGIYLSLIVTNCVIMGRAEAFAGRSGPVRSLFDALGSGLGFGLVLFAVGSARELLGSGTWFAGASGLLGAAGTGLECAVIPQSHTLLIAILPPGGFFALAFLIALKNAWSLRRASRRENSLRIRSLRD